MNNINHTILIYGNDICKKLSTHTNQSKLVLSDLNICELIFTVKNNINNELI
jgi:hypothetical protein